MDLYGFDICQLTFAGRHFAQSQQLPEALRNVVSLPATRQCLADLLYILYRVPSFQTYRFIGMLHRGGWVKVVGPFWEHSLNGGLPVFSKALGAEWTFRVCPFADLHFAQSQQLLQPQRQQAYW